MRFDVTYFFAVFSAVGFGLASVLEQRATRSARSLSGLSLPGFRSLLGNWQYLLGLALDGLSYGLFLLAIRRLPLFFVQAVDTGSIAVTATAAHFLLRTVLHKRDYLIISFLLVGLVMVGLASSPEHSGAASTLVLECFAIVGIATASTAIIVRRYLSDRPLLTALVSGLCFSSLAILSRLLPQHAPWVTLSSVILAMIITTCGVLGLMLFTMAIQKGSITYVYAINFTVETVIPATAGFIWLGDVPRHGLWWLVILGEGITLCSTSALVSGKEYIKNG